MKLIIKYRYLCSTLVYVVRKFVASFVFACNSSKLSDLTLPPPRPRRATSFKVLARDRFENFSSSSIFDFGLLSVDESESVKFASNRRQRK